MPAAKNLRHDIQGLRALAVVLVVVFHLSPKTLPGGYIGVDVFFVISGYLITGHLLKEVYRTGSVRLTEFWARRVRRLLPAAFLVLLVSVGMVFLLLPSTVRIQNLTEIAFASVYALNWRLAADSVDYLATDNPASIAQHYWSLSVEEQFYLLWPILIIVAAAIAAKSKKVSPKQAIILVLLLVFLLSLGFSIAETARSQPSAYFITTTRAWEFAAGGLVALLPDARLKRLSYAAGSWIALGAVVGAALIFDSSTSFPGWIALAPVLGTCFLLWAGDSESTWTPQYLAKAGPIQLLGDTSYAVYLWHWPLIIAATSVLGRAPGWKWAILLFALTVLLAIGTKHLIEDPVRRAPGLLKQPRFTFAFMASGVAITLLLTVLPTAVMQFQAHKFQQRIQAAIAETDGCFGAYAVLNDCANLYAVTDTVSPDVTRLDVAFDGEGLEECASKIVGDRSEVACSFPGAGMRMFFMGDSHARQLIPTVAEIAEEQGWALEARSRSGCSGFEEAQEGDSERQRLCAHWGDAQINHVINSSAIDVVLIAARSVSHKNSSAHVSDTMQRFLAEGKQVMVIRSAPGTENTIPPNPEAMSAPECVLRSESDRDPCAWQPEQWEDWLIEGALDAGADVIDLRDIVCSDSTCHVVVGGTIVYWDNNHFAAVFARTLKPWLEKELRSYSSL